MTCRICTANDEEALIEQMAAAMWQTYETSDTHTEWDPWERATPYWRNIMLNHARASLQVLRQAAAPLV